MERLTTPKALRAELGIGLLRLDGSLIDEADIIKFVLERSGAHHLGGDGLGWRLQRTRFVYAGVEEEGLLFTTDRNVRYNPSLSDTEWKELVERVAAQTAHMFGQLRVYISYVHLDEQVILQKQVGRR